MPVDFSNDDVDRSEELEYVLADRGGGGGENARAVEPDALLELGEDSLPGQLILKLEPERNPLPGEKAVVSFQGNPAGPGDQSLLEHRQAGDPLFGSRLEFLPDPGHTEEGGRAHLLDVLGKRLERFGEVHLDPVEEWAIDRADLLGDVRKRQIRKGHVAVGVRG